MPEKRSRPRTVAATWLDRTIGFVSPRWHLNRLKDRVAVNALNQFYEAAGTSRRTKGWKRPSGDPNASTSLSLKNLRDSARQLVRNNGHAESAVGTIAEDVVGWGIMPAAINRHQRFRDWSTSVEIDADGVCDLPGLENLVMREIVESGECLIRRRFRRPSDGLALPLQIQILEADHIDTGKHLTLPNSGKIVRGVEVDAIGKRVAYWLFRDHPGSTNISNVTRFGQSQRVPASEILHVYRIHRAGQARGASWFAPVLIRFNDFDDLADATLMKQKVAACLAVLTTDPEGSSPRIGEEDTDDATLDKLQPGLIANLQNGRSITVVDPPNVRDYPEFSKTTLREIAAGLGVQVEDLTGDYADINFSAARMSRVHHDRRVQGWRWRMMVPQFLNPLWQWAMEAAELAGLEVIERTHWTAPPLPMIEPDKEGLAIVRNIRGGIMTPDEALRQRGFIPEEFWDEYEKNFADLDGRGLITDADARQMTQAGQLHASIRGGGAADANATNLDSAPEIESSLEPSDYKSIPEVADRLDVTAATLRLWVRKGAIPHIRVGPGDGLIRVRMSDVARLNG